MAPSQLQETLSRPRSARASALCALPCCREPVRPHSCARTLSLSPLGKWRVLLLQWTLFFNKMMSLWCKCLPICLSHSPDHKSFQAMGWVLHPLQCPTPFRRWVNVWMKKETLWEPCQNILPFGKDYKHCFQICNTLWVAPLLVHPFFPLVALMFSSRNMLEQSPSTTTSTTFLPHP